MRLMAREHIVLGLKDREGAHTLGGDAFHADRLNNHRCICLSSGMLIGQFNYSRTIHHGNAAAGGVTGHGLHSRIFGPGI